MATLHRTVEESKRLNSLKGPRIIIASSGMMTGGRVLHHLRRLLPERKNLIVLAGYQAAGTRGRKLAEGAKHVRMYGADVPMRARLIQIEGLSAHADADDLVRWVGAARHPPRSVYLVHGEPPRPRPRRTPARKRAARHDSGAQPALRAHGLGRLAARSGRLVQRETSQAAAAPRRPVTCSL